MEACSLDLRERIVRAVDEGQSRLAVAKRFQVSNALIGKLLRQRRATGSIAPRPHAGGKGPALDAAALETLCDLVRAQPDATLAELCDRLGYDDGDVDGDAAAAAPGRPVVVVVGMNPVCRALRRLGLPLKKRRCTRPSATASA